MQNNIEDVDNELNRFESWSLSNQMRLLEGLKALIQRQKRAKPLYDVREFRGIGHETWDDVGGVNEFTKQERVSWDD